MLVVLELGLLLFFALGTHGLIVSMETVQTTDFASFYAAGKLAAAGTPELAYDQIAHLAAERQATYPNIDYLYFYYPPVFMLICVLLAQLSYLPAFYLFQVTTMVPYLLVGRATLGQKGWAGWLLLLTPPAVYWTFGLGQNAFLTAALFGAGLLLIDRRPVLAGILLGLICYKPHFGLLIPVALAAGGHWRAFAGATASVLAVVALSMGVFGWETWHAYVMLAIGAQGSYEDGAIELAAFVTPFGGARLMGIPVAWSYAIQGAATLAAAVAVGYVWRRKLSLPIRAATLASATLIAIQVALLYDMMLSAIAIFWLIRAARENGYMPWEKIVLALVLITPMVSRPLGLMTGIPAGPLAAVALLVVALACARREMACVQQVPLSPS